MRQPVLRQRNNTRDGYGISPMPGLGASNIGPQPPEGDDDAMSADKRRTDNAVTTPLSTAAKEVGDA